MRTLRETMKDKKKPKKRESRRSTSSMALRSVRNTMHSEIAIAVGFALAGADEMLVRLACFFGSSRRAHPCCRNRFSKYIKKTKSPRSSGDARPEDGHRTSGSLLITSVSPDRDIQDLDAHRRT